MSNPVIDEYGTKHWYNEKGERHRLDGPAVELSNGEKHWYQNGKRHRLDGPAVEWANGCKEYWIDGQELTKEEFNKQKPIELQPMVNRFTALMNEL